MNLAPNFIGGYEGRQAYLNGERCFNDENAVAAFQAVADIAPFFPDGQEALTYYDSQQLFLQGQAAMWLGGSWDIPVFEKEAPTSSGASSPSRRLRARTAMSPSTWTPAWASTPVSRTRKRPRPSWSG